ncbi:MAG: DNA topoisomerase III [Plesiomonas shigelloides]
MRLFIAEKPSLGRAIAEVLGVTKKQNGYLECQNGDVVTWCIGHLLEQAEPEHYGDEYKNWSLDTLPIIPKEWVAIPKEETKDQLSTVVKLIKQADILVNAGDPDREGVYLVNEVIEYAGVDQAKRDKALRVLINDLNPKAIEQALATMEPNSKHQAASDAALCRSRADWLLGMNMSRACTVLAKQQGHPGIFSVGRVQTPTLQLVVKRDAEIANFKPVPFFDVEAVFSEDGAEFKAKWQVPESVSDEKRCTDKTIADAVIAAVTNQSATVTRCETKRAVSQPPLTYSLRSLQEDMSRSFGFGAKQTLDLVQSLYETHKIVSYPRTDQPYLSTNKRDEIDLILGNLEGLKDTPLADYAANADTSLTSPAWNDKKLEGAAHTAIIPTTRAPDLSKLTQDELRVYEAIALRYLAQFYAPAEDDNTVIEIQSGDHQFKTSGKVEIKSGWRVVLGKEKDSDTESQSLPVLGEGVSITCDAAKLQEKKTTPPKPFTEGTLLTGMCNIAKDVEDPAMKAKLKETAGLGTEATRAGIIEILKERGYLTTKGKTLVSTDSGRMLIMGLPAVIRDPAITAIWEQQLDVVESGEYSVEKFMAVMEKTIAGHINDLKTGKTKFSLPKSTYPTCPKSPCKGFLLPYQGKKGTAHRCSVCETRFKDDKGKPGAEIKKIAKLEV